MRSREITVFAGFTAILVLIVTRTIPAQGPAPNAAVSVLERALDVHGRQWSTGEIADSVSEGKLTLFAQDGPKATFDLRILRKGNNRLQRVIKQPGGELKQGTDGAATWEAFAGFYTPSAQGRAMQFIESQTTRSIPRLLNYQKEGLTLRDRGTQDKDRVVDSEDRQGHITSYFIDAEKSFITRLEFTVGQTKDPLTGTMLPDTDRYIFSDYRQIQGLLTPFKIERYNARNKLEEMQFSAVRYNAGLKDGDFQR